MRILITNNCLNFRGGAESFVRDLARGLQARGHVVMAYSSDIGQAERFLESDLIPVATDLANLPFQPDIIHAQHHLDAMTALAALPETPAIYHCHGAVWRECVPKHPRIYHYLAMSRTLAERISIESNIPASDLSVALNGVDLRRFHQVRPPPKQLQRGIFYNGHHRLDDPVATAVVGAADQLGIKVDFIGRRFGQMFDRPEQALLGYDLVFASGLSAIEAVACGCAVMVVGRSSCGAMVRAENFDHFRQTNFSISAITSPPSVESITAELARYSAEDSALVTQRLRQEADFTLLVESLEKTYTYAISCHQSAPKDHRAESLAMSLYLRRIVPLIKMTDEAQKSDHMSALAMSSLISLREDLSAFQQELGKAQELLDSSRKSASNP